MKVKNYIPSLYENNIDMQAIGDSETTEFENHIKKDITDSFHNTFIKLANEKGIEQYEEIFDIKPNLETETLEFRRQRIMSRLISQIPFTENYMISVLNEILGKDNWEYEIDYNNYELTISSDIPGKGWLNELNEFLARTIPCNIDYEVVTYAATWQLVNDNFASWQAIKDTDMTWEDLMDAEWLT